MKAFTVNGKYLQKPSFFQIYNFGGGAGDKYREIVYADLTEDIPALVNYLYLNNNYPHIFQSKKLNNIEKFDSIGDIFNYVRKSLIEDDHCVYSNYNPPEYDFNRKIFLLDSGSFNIIKKVAEKIDYDKNVFSSALTKHINDYYDFANRYKFDLVTGFDLGGKYTFKDGEADKRLIEFYNSLDKDKINYEILEKTVDYLSVHPDFYPKLLAPVHGKTPEDYANNTLKIIELERASGYSFWGFALGNIASSKNADKSWIEGIDLSSKKDRSVIDAIIPARASLIVHNIVGDRPIHALGGGGYPNILLNAMCGATSFDAATPSRRVGDGNALSANYVFDVNAPKKSNGSQIRFSKFFVGGINSNDEPRKEPFGYKELNKIDADFPLCGCPACNLMRSITELKNLYASKSSDEEANYFARQLINVHSVWQHHLLCRAISENSQASFIRKYGEINLISELSELCEEIKRVN